jgi:hypothetical protein
VTRSEGEQSQVGRQKNTRERGLDYGGTDAQAGQADGVTAVTIDNDDEQIKRPLLDEEGGSLKFLNTENCPYC